MKKYIDVKRDIHCQKLCFDNANIFYYTEWVRKYAVMWDTFGN